MKEYERLTKRTEQLGVPYSEEKLFDVIERLAELEDKIENGMLIELNKPYIKQQSNGLYIVCMAQEIGLTMGVKSKAEAEAKLKELKGE